jgi:hypothetical protein
LIELIEGFWCDPFAVTVIKKIDENKCALWTTGQSALEGFVLDYPVEEVAQAVTDACEEPNEGKDDEE